VANIANGFATSIEMYSVCRFFAGIGLAGELGGCIALVSEVLSKERRGYGTALIAAVGVSGAVVAGTVAELVSWQTNYFIGGGFRTLSSVHATFGSRIWNVSSCKKFRWPRCSFSWKFLCTIYQ
jgi:MFS family permease